MLILERFSSSILDRIIPVKLWSIDSVCLNRLPWFILSRCDAQADMNLLDVMVSSTEMVTVGSL